MAVPRLIVKGNPHPLAGAGDWQPASGGTERPFITRTGRRLQYVWQPRTGAHAYYDVDRDIILSDDEALRALGETRAPLLLENQTPAPNLLGYAVLAGFGAALLYAIFRPRPAAAAMPAPTVPAACTLETTEDFARLEAWSTTKDIGVVYLPATAAPPLPERSALAQSFVSTRAAIVVVTNDGKFWTYDTGQPVESTVFREDFCAFKPPAAVSGMRWV